MMHRCISRIMSHKLERESVRSRKVSFGLCTPDYPSIWKESLLGSHKKKGSFELTSLAIEKTHNNSGLDR